jgi:hypothetical protein
MRDELETLALSTNNFRTRYACCRYPVPFMGQRARGCSKGTGEILTVGVNERRVGRKGGKK